MSMGRVQLEGRLKYIGMRRKNQQYTIPKIMRRLISYKCRRVDVRKKYISSNRTKGETESMVTDVSSCKQIQEFSSRELRRCPFDYFLLQKEDVRHQVKEWYGAQRWKAGSCLFYLNFFFLVNIDWNLQRCIQIMVIIRLLKIKTRGTKTQNNFSHKA